MKTLILILTLASCSSYVKIKKFAPPSWVEMLREGKQTIKVNSGSKYLYRAIYKDKDQNYACDRAIDSAKGYIQSEYPFLDDFPFKIEHLYFDDRNEDCSATISIKNNIASKLAELNRLREEYREEAYRLESNLKAEKRKNRELQKKLSALNEFLSKNAHLLKDVKLRQNLISQISSRVRNEEQRAQKYAITGARVSDMEKLIGASIDITSVSWLSSRCYAIFNSSYISQHGTVRLCWSGSSYDRATRLLGYCDKKNCWQRDP